MKSKILLPTVLLATFSLVSMGAFAASTTAGGEEQWQIVEEGSPAAKPKTQAKPAPAKNHKVASTSNSSSSQGQSKSRSNARSSQSSSGSFKLGMGLDQGFGVVGQIHNKVNFAIGNDGIAADYIFNKGSFGSDVPFTWFAGVGGQIKKHDKFGPRIALGVELDISRNWDAYAQLTPNVMFHESDLKFGMGAGIGIRYQF
ncbi:hypothetical protein LNL84_01180 [Vibrio sp. ZSDZ34]|jgi:hypothetical protein|uniref:Outer membrane protein beta-barrel domain-containing protein n=1 Tax=Vibrio gelatinilyticus TaxID=2893468 RepID=A0A9X1W741_9VIBR|nr:hypothetical protein [Vibrio gelatinilyticus]MCJ2375442.1 hypothetical protein [Vibrio gelatinilyticus]